MFLCRIKRQEYPKEGELVLAKTCSTSDDILNMELVEYGDIPGLVLSNEISKRRVRSIHQITKVGAIEVCRVLRADPGTHQVDLSLRTVEPEEKKEYLAHANKEKLAYQIMLRVARDVNIPVEKLYEDIGYGKMEEYGSLYAFFVQGKNNPGALSGVKYGEHFARDITEQFTPTSFKVRMDVDVVVYAGGITAIKRAFAAAKEAEPQAEFALLKSPTFSISCVGSDKQAAFDAVTHAGEVLRTEIASYGGSFDVTTPATVYGSKSKHALLEDEDASAKAKDASSEDEDSE